MRIALDFPPFSTITGSPPVALATLDAYLQEHGVSVALRDSNMEFFNFVTSCWDEIEGPFSRSLERRLSGNDKSLLPRKRLKLLHGLFVPLVNRLLLTKNYELLQYVVKDVTNAYFLDDIFSSSPHLHTSYSNLSSRVSEKIYDPILTSFLDQFEWDDLDLLGFSILAETQFPYAMLMSRHLRKRNPDLKVVIGGPYVTEVYKQLIRYKELWDDFDYLVVYEGESALLSILEYEENSGSNEHPKHPNVFSVNNHNHVNGPFHLEDFEKLPMPDFKRFDLSLYFPLDLSLPVFSSKGCTWCRCAFCSINHIRHYREQSLSRFVKGMANITRNTGVSHFQITDEDIPPDRLRTLSNYILKYCPTPVQWTIQTRFYRRLDRELLFLAKKAGCYRISFGLETASLRMLKLIRKGISLKRARQIISDCDSAGISVVLNCMVGFPTEQQADSEQTVAFLDEILKRHPGLDVTCNTQSVKIYRSAAFGKDPAGYAIDCLTSYDLSPVIAWDGPSWVRGFMNKHRSHLLMTRTSRHVSTHMEGYCGSNQDIIVDPLVALSQRWVLLNGDEDQKVKAQEQQAGTAYIAMTSNPTLHVFELNETSLALLKLLSSRTLSFSELKRRFLLSYKGFQESEVLEVLGKGLILLSEQGIVNFYENQSSTNNKERHLRNSSHLSV